MRVGTKIRAIIIFIIILLIGGVFVFLEEYRTRDNATHLLLMTKNQHILENIFNDLGKLSSSSQDQQKRFLTTIQRDYIQVKESTNLLLEGGDSDLGTAPRTIIPVFYTNVSDTLKKVEAFTLSEIHKLTKFINEDSLILTESTLTSMTENCMMLKNQVKNSKKVYYDKYASKMSLINKGLLASFIFILIGIIYLYWFLNSKILQPSYFLRKALISTSYENDVLKISNNTLFKDIGVYLHNLQNELHTSTDFINEVGDGNFEIYLEGKTTLASALRKMQSKLKESYKRETRTSWTSQGLASLGTIIRNNTENIDHLAKEVLTMVVDYVKCEQGVLYVKKQDKVSQEDYFGLLDHYGLSKEKYNNDKIFKGEGLIGELFDNPQMTFITELPDGYTIMSGLGEAKPNCLLIIPLLTNQDELVGALELTSFKVLKPHEIELIEQMGESIATSLSSVLNTFHTEQLLIESQDLTKRLRSQEDHMRKNMSALQNAQEEMVRNQIELEGVFKSIDQTLGTIELSIDGYIISTNKMILNILMYKEEEIIDKSLKEFLPKHSNLYTQYDSILKKLVSNESVTGDYQWYNKKEQVLWLNLTLTPVKNQIGEIFKIILLAKDVTQRKEEELEIQRLSLVADTTENAVLIVNNLGLIEYINPGFSKTTGYLEEDVIGEEPAQFLYGEKTDELKIEEIAEKLRLEISFTEEVLMHHENGETYWASLFVNPVFSNNNHLEKYIFLLVDITDTKTSELDYSYKMNAISQSNAMLEIDLNGNIIATNENFLEIVGYKEEEIITKEYSYLMTKESKIKFLDLLTVIKKGEFLNGEYKRIHKSGKELWIREVYNPIFDLDGQMIKIIVFTVDVTHEKLLEVVSEEKDLELKEHSKAVNKTIASVEFGMDGEILGANDIFLGVFGYTLEELLGKNESILLLESDRKKPQHQIMWDNLKAGKYFEGEFQNIGKNQHPIWLKGTYNPIFNREGIPYKIKMLAQFTTDDKEREVSLNGIVNAVKTSFLYLEINPNLTVKSSNSLFLEYTGYKRMELRKKNIASVLRGGKAIDLENLVTTLHAGKSFEGEFIVQTKEKEKDEKSFSCFFHPIKDLQNQISKIIVFLV